MEENENSRGCCPYKSAVIFVVFAAVMIVLGEIIRHLF